MLAAPGRGPGSVIMVGCVIAERCRRIARSRFHDNPRTMIAEARRHADGGAQAITAAVVALMFAVVSETIPECALLEIRGTFILIRYRV